MKRRIRYPRLMYQWLSQEEWTKRAAKHRLLVSPYADPFLQRRAVRQTHPVHDFLFTYYPFSPAKLKEWVPSFEEGLLIESVEVLKFSDYWFIRENNRVRLNPSRLQGQALGMIRFIEELCTTIGEKPARFGCFGLHEWAMVYRSSQEEIRHSGYPLRLPREELARFVESQTLCCTHYDAYRFFTPAARPRNALEPTLQTRLQHEQAGCVHANMDLYKWATKLWPWIGSDFIARAFLLALEGRELDMRASPYDLQEHSISPIRIETEEGRRQYQLEQLQYTRKTEGLRKELAAFCGRLALFRGF